MTVHCLLHLLFCIFPGFLKLYQFFPYSIESFCLALVSTTSYIQFYECSLSNHSFIVGFSGSSHFLGIIPFAAFNKYGIIVLLYCFLFGGCVFGLMYQFFHFCNFMSLIQSIMVGGLVIFIGLKYTFLQRSRGVKIGIGNNPFWGWRGSAEKFGRGKVYRIGGDLSSETMDIFAKGLN